MTSDARRGAMAPVSTPPEEPRVHRLLAVPPMSDLARFARRAWPVTRLLVIGGGAVLVAWVLSSHADELTGIESVFSHLNWALLVPAAVVEGASYVALAEVQRRALATGGVHTRRRVLTMLTLATQAVINSVPGGNAASTIYGFRWFRRLGASDSLAAWALVATAIVGVISLALVAAAGLGMAASYGASLDLVPVIIGVFVIAIAIGAIFLYHRPQQAAARWLLRFSRRLTGRPLGKFEAALGRVLAQFAGFRPSSAVVAVIVGCGVGSWVLDCGCFAFSFLAVGAGIPWKGLLLSYGAGQLAASLPITPGGLGVVEGSLTIALVAFGGNRVTTVEAVLVYRLISFWCELAVGWGAAGWLALGVRSGRWRRHVRGDHSEPAAAESLLHRDGDGPR
ncbi:MAG: lysylphosphatidylglycerol synthase transmembrane domain-containing protein [Acidimicrobiales bacterium]